MIKKAASPQWDTVQSPAMVIQLLRAVTECFFVVVEIFLTLLS